MGVCFVIRLIMQKLLLLLALLSGLAMAQDNSFEREFSKFDKDFERLNTWKAETPASKKLKRAPAAPASSAESASANASAVRSEPAITPLDDAPPVTSTTEAATAADDKPATDTIVPAKPLQSTAVPKNLPKGAKVEKLARNDLLGHQISDPEVRKKVQELYQRPDVVVQQYVLPTN
jgi:hypothetical protein